MSESSSSTALTANRVGVAVLLGALLTMRMPDCRAQDLEPRVYSPNPIGAHFLGLAYVHSSGGVLSDPTLPISDVDAQLNTTILGYGQTFAVLNRSAIVNLAVPYVWGRLSGSLGEERREVTRSGLGDARLRLGLNLTGGAATTPAEFAKRKPETALGMSVTIVAPAGQYDRTKLVNIGANRWAFKPELGVSHPSGPWYVEAYAGVWLFTANDEFFGGSRRREQDPLATLQTHIVYTFRPHLWIAFDATLYHGGRTTVDGARNLDLQSNVRVGLTVSLPTSRRQSLKLSWSDGVSTRIGSDFTTLGVAWQYMWVD